MNEGESFSALRLGDYYYYGLINEINYEKAAYYYKKVIEFNNEEIFIAQAYFNLAYMHQYGLGVEKDLNKSGKYYNKTYETNKLSWISVTIAEILLYFESRFITDDIYHSFGFFIIHDIISKFIGYKILKIPYVLLIGMISHHPANLDFANNKAQNKIPTYGYALVYPLLLIGKIIFVQMLWQVLRIFG